MSRLSRALLVALALHGLLLLVRARHARSPSTPLIRQELVDVDETSVEPASPELAPAPVTEAREPAARSANALAARAVSHTSQPDAPTAQTPTSSDAASNGGLPTEGAPASSAQASAEKPRKIDLGLDGNFFLRPPSEEFPRVRKPEFQRQLEASIAADDVKHGLARGNALLGSLDAAARDAGPVRGEALLTVTVGADGSLTDVQVLRGSASEWSSALNSFRALAAHKRVRIPSGARGLRVTFSVKSKVQLPSGQAVSAGNIDAPSLLPNGLTFGGKFDVADIGSGPQRMVYARVVSEEAL